MKAGQQRMDIAREFGFSYADRYLDLDDSIGPGAGAAVGRPRETMVCHNT
jgi:hypothetical protein